MVWRHNNLLTTSGVKDMRPSIALLVFLSLLATGERINGHILLCVCNAWSWSKLWIVSSACLLMRTVPSAYGSPREPYAYKVNKQTKIPPPCSWGIYVTDNLWLSSGLIARSVYFERLAIKWKCFSLRTYVTNQTHSTQMLFFKNLRHQPNTYT